MPSIESLLFDEPGPANTEATLGAAARRAAELNIRQMVVATTTCATALKAADVFDGRIVGVTLQAGLWDKYAPPDPELLAQARERGIEILTGPHTLMGALDSAVKGQLGGLPAGEIVSRTYYTICQGFKVAVECVTMAADAGLVEMGGEVIGVAGTNDGADTALVMTPVFSHRLFDLKVHEILAMPR